MTRILWADDQQDVVATLRPVLSPLAPKVSLAKDGTEALQRLRNDHYDVLIVDLMMPPGKWGGLWLLEELRKWCPRIPVLVVSGEGQQAETIRALRLGAKDYVTKERVAEELLQQVQALLEASVKDMESFIASSFPTPLAVAYSRYLNASPCSSQLRKLIEFCESSLRLTCIIGLCELRSRAGVVDSPELAAKLLGRPSMGTWNELRRWLARGLAQDTAFHSLDKAFDNHAMDEIIRVRNDISHGSEPSERTSEDLLTQLTVDLQSLARNLWQTLSIQIFFPVSWTSVGSRWQADGHALAGDSMTLPRSIKTRTEPVASSRPYLLIGDDAEDPWVDLFPFLCAEPATQPNAWRVLMFDSVGTRARATATTGAEPLQYIDIWAGERGQSPKAAPTAGLLPPALFHLA